MKLYTTEQLKKEFNVKMVSELNDTDVIFKKVFGGYMVFDTQVDLQNYNSQK